MKRSYVTAIGVGICWFGLTAGCVAQSTARTYLNGNFSEVKTEDEARYYRETMHGLHEGTQVRVHYIDGTLKMEGNYRDANLQVPNGMFTYYYRNGQIESQGEYFEGRKCGVWKRWNWDGSAKADRLYPDRKSAAQTVSEPAQFPGGYDAMLTFIANNTPYPDEAIAKKITGVVKISFRIDEGGLVRDVEVVERNASILADAAMECMWNMPLWTPARKNGRDVSSTFILPLIFSIKDGRGQVRVGP
jgi:TonB family protein